LADTEGTVSDFAEVTSDGELIASGARPTQAQIGVALGIAALVAVLIALVVVAARR
jgi:hypothetical protein